MRYQIIASGSRGNAVVLEDVILIDCGVPYRDIAPFQNNLKLVLLTHIHGDHFRKSTIRRLASERPMLRFGCGEWLVDPLIALGVARHRIDILSVGKQYGYAICSVIPVPLVHNVPNQGYKIFIKGRKAIYCTDTGNLNGIFAKGYDLYLIEANYEDEELDEKIAYHKEHGEYSYEVRVRRDHLSKQQCDDFIFKNADARSSVIYMHQHEEDNDNEWKDT